MQKACLKVSTENIRTLLFVSRLWANNPIGERIHIKCQLDSFRDCMKNLTFNQAIDVTLYIYIYIGINKAKGRISRGI